MPLPQGGAPKTLTLQVRAFVNAKIPQQRVQVVINGTPYPELQLTNPENNIVTLTISPLALKQGYIALRFIYLDAHSPFSLGLGEDIRMLGIGIKSAQLD